MNTSFHRCIWALSISNRVMLGMVAVVLAGCSGEVDEPNDAEDVGESALALTPGANLIVNASFELGYEQTTDINGGWPVNANYWAPIGYYGATDAIPGWTVSGGGVDWHDSSSGPHAGEPTAVDGFRAVDLNSAFDQCAGAISQAIATTPGAPYVVTFSYSAHPYPGCYFGPKPMQASAGDASVVVTPDPASEGYLGSINIWRSATLRFTATSSSTTISFASLLGGSCAGPLVDDVVVEAAPLPTSKEQCKNGGWQVFSIFENQGDCISFVATKGKNLPSP
jgi:hypothetical protein